MPFEVPLSQINDRATFEQAVADHVERMNAFQKEKGKPRPVSHPLVEAAVKRIAFPISARKPDEYKADYTFKDDAPPAPTDAALSLEDKKRQLTAALRQAEHTAKEKIFPIRKQRLFMLGINPLVGKKVEDLTDDEKSRLDTHKDYHERLMAVEHKAAQAESDIEDLTDDTVDKWQVPELG